MNEFEFWQRWGLELNDKQFANAFTVLGVLAASSTGKVQSSTGNTLKEKFLKVLDRAREKGHILPWRFPRPTQHTQLGNEAVCLSDLDPGQVTRLWSDLASSAVVAFSLQVLTYPETELIKPWFRLLFEADPPVEAAYIVYNPASVYPHLKWPLRIGYLGGNNGKIIVEKASHIWPANELTRPVKIDRDNANCDVLVFHGSSRQLLRELLDLPGRQKSNLIIVCGRIDDNTAPVKQRLAALSSETSASGYIFLNPDIQDKIMVESLNGFITNLSHNQPMAAAISEAYQKTDPAIFLSRHLATFKIERFIEKFTYRLTHLPKESRPQINTDTLRFMGIPENSIRFAMSPPKKARRAMRPVSFEPGRFASVLDKNRYKLDYRNEHRAGRGFAEISKAVDHAESRADGPRRPPRRFLQEQVIIKKNGEEIEERRCFRKGIPTLIRVRVGPPRKKWVSIMKRFPEEKLPKDRDEWRLSVVLTEPNHQKEPLRGTIKLPRSGPSTECEFRIIPKKYPLFEGRITVLHRGRVLQTGVLKGKVVAKESEISEGDAITFTDILSIRSHLDDLEGRRQFDLAFVENHTADEKPRLTAISPNDAWISDITGCDEAVRDINNTLSSIKKVIKKYKGGLENKENVNLLLQIARSGQMLFEKIVELNIEHQGNSSLAETEYIQIVSTKSDNPLPLEFIYDAGFPNDDAKLCPSFKAIVKKKDKNARTPLTKDLIESTCQQVGKNNKFCPYRSNEYICPMGFWGVSKVIERHIYTPGLPQEYPYYLQPETTADRNILDISGTAVVSASQIVTPPDGLSAILAPVRSACKKQFGFPAQIADSWQKWVELVNTYKPCAFIALTHTAGNIVNASLEIGGTTLYAGQISAEHVHAENDNTTHPLVALIGCDTAWDGLNCSRYVTRFRLKGAAIVIGTIAMVFKDHALSIAEQLVKGLKQEKGQKIRIGEIIRSVKRQALLDGPLPAMCVVAFGDADWELK